MGERAERSVLEFMREMEVPQWDADQIGRVLARMAPEAEYHVYAWEAPVRGHEALRAEFDRQVPTFSDFRTDIKAIASTGQTVFVERVDTMVFHGQPLTQHIAGVYQVDDEGMIVSWRDYFDSKEVTTQLGTDVTTAGSR